MQISGLPMEFVDHSCHNKIPMEIHKKLKGLVNMNRRLRNVLRAKTTKLNQLMKQHKNCKCKHQSSRKDFVGSIPELVDAMSQYLSNDEVDFFKLQLESSERNALFIGQQVIGSVMCQPLDTRL